MTKISFPGGSSSGGGGGGSALLTPDDPTAWASAFGAASVFDQEFSRTTNPTTLPTGWVLQSDNSAAYVEQLGNGVISEAAGRNTIDTPLCIVQPVSAAGAYTAVGKASTRYAAVHQVGVSSGLILTDGTKGVGICWNTNPLVLTSTWTNIASTYGVTIDSEVVSLEAANIPYWKIKKNNANSYDFFYSYDGINWFILTAAYDVGAFMTPTHFGFLLREGSGAQSMSMDWFRVR